MREQATTVSEHHWYSDSLPIGLLDENVSFLNAYRSQLARCKLSATVPLFEHDRVLAHNRASLEQIQYSIRAKRYKTDSQADKDYDYDPVWMSETVHHVKYQCTKEELSNRDNIGHP